MSDIATDLASRPQALNFTTLDPDKTDFKPAQQEALGQAEFFKLLTTQLASQDPLKPMDDTAFIAQMANFSQLEMMSNLNENFEAFTSLQQFQASQGYIGKKVTMLVDGEEISGIASGLEHRGDETTVYVDGKGYNIDSVFRVEQSSVDSSPASSAQPSESAEHPAGAVVKQPEAPVQEQLGDPLKR